MKKARDLVQKKKNSIKTTNRMHSGRYTGKYKDSMSGCQDPMHEPCKQGKANLPSSTVR